MNTKNRSRTITIAIHLGLAEVCVCVHTANTANIKCHLSFLSVFYYYFFTFDYAKGTQTHAHGLFSVCFGNRFLFCFATFSYHNSTILLWIDYLIYISHSIDGWIIFHSLLIILTENVAFFLLICFGFFLFNIYQRIFDCVLLATQTQPTNSCLLDQTGWFSNGCAPKMLIN